MIDLKARLNGANTCFAVPGCWDGLSAFLIEEAGFEVAFLSGAALSMTRLGRPDMAFTDASELGEAVRRIRDRTEMALIVDADTGFGNALNVQKTVRDLERAGAAAIQLEDQTSPKRCGHMSGKSVISASEATQKIKAALDARANATTLISARTDAYGVEGLNSAMDRADMFLEAGADILFIEGPRTLEEMRTIQKRFAHRAPLAHNLVEGAKTPVLTGAELDALGYRIAYHPLALLHLLANAAPTLLAHIKRERETASLKGELTELHAMNARLGADDLIARGGEYDGA